MMRYHRLLLKEKLETRAHHGKHPPMVPRPQAHVANDNKLRFENPMKAHPFQLTASPSHSSSTSPPSRPLPLLPTPTSHSLHTTLNYIAFLPIVLIVLLNQYLTTKCDLCSIPPHWVDLPPARFDWPKVILAGEHCIARQETHFENSRLLILIHILRIRYEAPFWCKKQIYHDLFLALICFRSSMIDRFEQQADLCLTQMHFR
nr:hypothetical protein HmN_000802100 [Hymenolepis microstoma]